MGITTVKNIDGKKMIKDLQSLCCYCLCVFNKVNSAEAPLPESLLDDVSVSYQTALDRCLCGRMTVSLAWTLTKSGHVSVMNAEQSTTEIKVKKMSTNALS